MTCNITCLNEGICSLNDTCTCPVCFMGERCELSTNVIKFSMTYAMHWDIQQASVYSSFNIPEFVYTTVIAVMVLMALINNIACLQTFFQADIRLTNCGLFQILYCFIGLFTIIGLQLRMLTLLEFDSLTEAYSYRYIACNIIPVIFIIMVDVCTWLSALLVIEYVLLECFNFNLYRTRWYSAISSTIAILLISGSHLHEIIARRPKSNPDQLHSYTCTYIYSLPLDIIDKVLRACHVIIPCAIHFIASICILISITRRTLLVRDRNDLFRVFIDECIKRKYFFVPPFIIILTNLPHLILHLKDECEDARNISLLRLHVSFNILVYLPPSITFFIYIYPSKSYMHKFKQTFIGKLIFRKPKINRSRTESTNTLSSNVSYTPPIMKNDSFLIIE